MPFAFHCAVALVAMSDLTTLEFPRRPQRSVSGGSSIPTIMDAIMLKELAATCWKQLEDFSAYLVPKNDARQLRFGLCRQVLKCLNAVESDDCSAVKVWMSLRGLGMSPDDSGVLAAAARDSAAAGSSYGQFVLGFMHGFLGAFFWDSCDWGKRDKEEAIRLMELARASDVVRPIANFYLGCIHELGRDFVKSRKAYADCPDHAIAVYQLSNLQSDGKEARRLKAAAIKLGYDSIKDDYYNVYGRGTSTLVLVWSVCGCMSHYPLNHVLTHFMQVTPRTMKSGTAM